MLNNPSVRFKKHYPGPYSYLRSSNGVDDTFDVVCLGTEQPIVSAPFWYDRLPCELIAHVVSSALNDQILGDADDSNPMTRGLSERELAAFRGMHSGPFATTSFTCDLYGPGWEVRCTTTGNDVIAAYGSGLRSHARLIAAHIASALNRLP